MTWADPVTFFYKYISHILVIVMKRTDDNPVMGPTDNSKSTVPVHVPEYIQLMNMTFKQSYGSGWCIT